MILSAIAPETESIGTVARKRRRQIIQSQRIKNEDLAAPQQKKPCVEPISNSELPLRKSRDEQTTNAIVTIMKSNCKTKKPQMRYDPDVPMSKEDAAVWRKEQRRKRNRESAAASRQRQRDRITELEEEVSEWKLRYEEAIARIEKLERMGNADCSASVSSAPPAESAAVSPYSSPRQSRSPSFVSSSMSYGMVSLQDPSQSSLMETSPTYQGMHEQGDHVKHLSEKISRPA